MPATIEFNVFETQLMMLQKKIIKPGHVVEDWCDRVVAVNIIVKRGSGQVLLRQTRHVNKTQTDINNAKNELIAMVMSCVDIKREKFRTSYVIKIKMARLWIWLKQKTKKWR